MEIQMSREGFANFIERHPYISFYSMLFIGFSLLIIFMNISSLVMANNPCSFSSKNTSGEFEYIVKSQLRDPKSFELIEATGGDWDQDYMFQKLVYRAKNGFGGYNTETTMGLVHKRNCKISLM